MKMTATEIRLRISQRYGPLDRSWPYWMQHRRAQAMSAEALAYLDDPDFEIAPVARQAIKDWAAELKNI